MEENTKAVAVMLSVTVGPMALVTVLGIIYQDWTIAIIAAFFAVLCGVLSMKEVRGYVTEDSASTVHQTRER